MKMNMNMKIRHQKQKKKVSGGDLIKSGDKKSNRAKETKRMSQFDFNKKRRKIT